MKQDINSTANQLFFHLLSAAIWDKEADAALFQGLDDKIWKQIADMAIRQSVSALIADKALSLPQECLPSMSIKLQFLAYIQKTEALNKKMIKVLGNLKEEYDQAGFPFCLLKGLSVGVNYPKPLLRSAGDIDLYLYGEGDYQKSKEWVSLKEFDVLEDDEMHYAFIKEGVLIENHRRFTYFDNKKYDNLLKKQEELIMKKDCFPIIDIEGVKLQQLPLEINALFVFHHLFRHFVHAGVGMRQLCDWILLISAYKKVIDTRSFTDLANKYALLYPMQVFAVTAIKYLGAPKDIFPFQIIEENNHIEMIIEDILLNGNFGFHLPGKARPKGKLLGMLFSYKIALSRSVKFSALSSNHIKSSPYYVLVNKLKTGFK